MSGGLVHTLAALSTAATLFFTVFSAPRVGLCQIFRGCWPRIRRSQISWLRVDPFL
jgi:hypothetical protein